MKLLRLLVLAIGFFATSADVGMSAPGDVTMERSGKAEKTYPPATFPHWAHSIRYRCYACHPALFKMVKFKTAKGSLKEDRGPLLQVGSNKDKEVVEDEETGKKKEAEKKPEAGTEATAAKQTTSQEQKMHGRTACGMCHDGKVAFNVEFSACARCHVPK